MSLYISKIKNGNILDKTMSSLLNNLLRRTWKISRSEDIWASAAKIVLYPFLCLIEASRISTVSESGNSAKNAGKVISKINCGLVLATSANALNTSRLPRQPSPAHKWELPSILILVSENNIIKILYNNSNLINCQNPLYD